MLTSHGAAMLLHARAMAFWRTVRASSSFAVSSLAALEPKLLYGRGGPCGTPRYTTVHHGTTPRYTTVHHGTLGTSRYNIFLCVLIFCCCVYFPRPFAEIDWTIIRPARRAREEERNTRRADDRHRRPRRARKCRRVDRKGCSRGTQSSRDQLERADAGSWQIADRYYTAS